jgi:hypothetical protein
VPQRASAAADRDRAAHLLVQRAVRGVPGLLGPGDAHVRRRRSHARRRGSLDQRGRHHPVDDAGQGPLPVLRATARRSRGRPGLLTGHSVAEAAGRGQRGRAARRELQGHGEVAQPLRPGDAVLVGIRGRRALHRAPVHAGRIRHPAPALGRVPARGALPRLQRRPAQARSARGARARTLHRRRIAPEPGRGADVLRRASAHRPRGEDRRRRAARDPRPPGLPHPGRSELSEPRPRGRHPLRRRSAAHPARDPDRLGPDRRAVRARRAVDRPAPARQPAPHRDTCV